MHKGLATRLMLLLRGEQLAREVEDVLRRGGVVAASARGNIPKFPISFSTHSHS